MTVVVIEMFSFRVAVSMLAFIPKWKLINYFLFISVASRSVLKNYHFKTPLSMLKYFLWR